MRSLCVVGDGLSSGLVEGSNLPQPPTCISGAPPGSDESRIIVLTAIGQDSAATQTAYDAVRLQASRMAGKRTTSRIELRPVRSIASRSIPMPIPPVGGMPCSSAATNTSS